MNAPARNFAAKTATREQVPLLIGLMGPSGCGKTFSALRLGSGIQEEVGGDMYVIDTEARRALHYADQFKFKHVQFDAPFGSLDYLEALRYCVKQGAGVIVVDSMSHEHEGPGGMLDLHDKELDRLAGNDWAKRERVKMLAWQKPKAARRQLINGLLQLNANFIFCFRAKETVKPMKQGGKTEIVPQGFMPIAGDEFLFEQTVNCLLLPKSGGVPTWQSDNVGEKMMMKLPAHFRSIFANDRPLDEHTGRALAQWARGGSIKSEAERPSPSTSDSPAPDAAADGAGHQSPPPVPSAEDYSAMIDSILDDATDAKELANTWTRGKDLRAKILWPDDEDDRHHWSQIKARVEQKIASLKRSAS
ncbi:MAG: AAA family ATPase [Rhizobiales bacterium]|nr:AAA family ATPase [Hyphomicrobiales bacterium]